MAMGKQRRRARQSSMWVATAALPRSAAHPFYERVNRVARRGRLDAFVEEQWAKFYADGVGRPSLGPGGYLRMLVLGYFEGLDSERAIAWRAADSLSCDRRRDASGGLHLGAATDLPAFFGPVITGRTAPVEVRRASPCSSWSARAGIAGERPPSSEPALSCTLNSAGVR